jgi:hypothetical protein
MEHKVPGTLDLLVPDPMDRYLDKMTERNALLKWHIILRGINY